eukprot:1333081-Rhodomonas_salina.1
MIGCNSAVSQLLAFSCLSATFSGTLAKGTAAIGGAAGGGAAAAQGGGGWSDAQDEDGPLILTIAIVVPAAFLVVVFCIVVPFLNLRSSRRFVERVQNLLDQPRCPCDAASLRPTAGKWNGSCVSKADKKQRRPRAVEWNFIFGADGSIKGAGRDTKGRFQIVGKVQSAEGKVVWLQTYGVGAPPQTADTDEQLSLRLEQEKARGYFSRAFEL